MAPYCIILCIIQSGKNTKPVKRETRLVSGLCLGGTVDYRGTEGIFLCQWTVVRLDWGEGCMTAKFIKVKH